LRLRAVGPLCDRDTARVGDVEWGASPAAGLLLFRHPPQRGLSPRSAPLVGTGGKQGRGPGPHGPPCPVFLVREGSRGVRDRLWGASLDGDSASPSGGGRGSVSGRVGREGTAALGGVGARTSPPPFAGADRDGWSADPDRGRVQRGQAGR